MEYIDIIAGAVIAVFFLGLVIIWRADKNDKV